MPAGGDAKSFARVAAGGHAKARKPAFKDKEKPDMIRSSNMTAAKAVADAIRTSLGPRGMDKMIQSGNGDVTITNDGATILNQMKVLHPTARMLVELSKAQDVTAGDGTTTVVVIAGSLLDAAEKLLQKGIHPSAISESFQQASLKAEQILENMSQPVDLDNVELLTKIAATSLNSKMVSQYSNILAPMSVSAVKKIMELKENNVDLRRIKIVKKLGGVVEDSELIDGALFDQHSCGVAGGPTKVEKAKVGLIQFQLSPPKTDV